MILTVCDAKYLSEASLLIKSCARHVPEQRFYLYLINDHGTPDHVIQRWHPQIIVKREERPYDRERWRGLMCCARAIPLRYILEHYNEDVLYLDSDTLVRAPLTELFGRLREYDLLVKHRPNLKHIGAAGTPYASSFNNGVIAIRPSESGLRFAQRYDERLQEFIDSGRPLEIYLEEHKIQCIVDQELLYVTYLELKEQIKFLLLATKFNDAQFDPNSIIWHGKGTARSHPLYALEKMRYEHAYLFHPLSLVSKALIMAHQFKRGRMVSSNV